MIDPVYILIRTSGRPKYFENMMESIKKQTYENIITIVHTDDVNDDYVDGDIILFSDRAPENGRGHYNLYCNKLLDNIPDTPGWYCFIDDDDEYIDDDVIERLVKSSKKECINVCHVRRWEGTVWPKNWGNQKSFQTECFFLHTDHKNLARWWSKTAGDHGYSRRLTEVLKINWIDDITACKAQKGKGRGQRLDFDQWKNDRGKKRISHVGARNLGPPVEVQYIRKTHGRKNERGLKGEVKIIPEKYAKRLEKVGRVVILNGDK